jgi:hypothetical protein
MISFSVKKDVQEGERSGRGINEKTVATANGDRK